jgi:hypothetical protein
MLNEWIGFGGIGPTVDYGQKWAPSQFYNRRSNLLNFLLSTTLVLGLHG